MPTIRLLDQATVNKIAAGEVVERPASVVKEMVENSIDAGASKVTVEIEGGGIRLIRISDNGCGIDKEQVRTAFLRHSTSKIRKVEDLEEKATLGFRGEALASIAAVARVEMVTRTESELTGIRFIIEGGEEKLYEEAACPVGTMVKVENLFYNTPPRFKFLKKPAAEAAYITDLMQKMVLGHPEISFRYMNGKKEAALFSDGSGSLKNSIYAVYGREIVDKMIGVKGTVDLSEHSQMTLTGFISRPQMMRANRNYENFFINGRYVKSAMLEKVLDEAYKDYVFPSTFPVAILHLNMDPACLDVNVHPTKMEIRFLQEERTRLGVYDLISKTLKEENLISRVGGFYIWPEAKARNEESEPKEPRQTVSAIDKQLRNANAMSAEEQHAGTWRTDAPAYYLPPKGARITKDYQEHWQKPSTDRPFALKEEPASYKPTMQAYSEDSDKVKYESEPETGKSEENPQPVAQPFSGEQITVHEDRTQAPELPVEEEAAVSDRSRPHHLRLIGQVFKTYWLAEEGDVFYIVDQHAAHERVYYDKFRELLDKGGISSQDLMTPVVCHVAPKSVVQLDSCQPVFEKLGYRLEAFGEDSVIVRGVPFLFGKPLPAEDIAALIDMICDGQMDATRDLLFEKIAMMSCKAAVKGNDAISFMEADSLLKQLFACRNPYNCPHGRPTIISIARYEMEKRFKRIV